MQLISVSSGNADRPLELRRKPAMFKKLLPKENRFFALFNEHCAIVVQGLEIFDALQEKQADKSKLNRQLKDIEHRADNIAHQVFELLNTVFVTPFDREDIRSLIHHMDDIMDMIEKAGIRLQIYQIDMPSQTVKNQFLILKKAFLKLQEAIGLLSNLKHKDVILDICIQVNSIENEGDQVLRQALARLFQTPGIDPLLLIKKKEIYERLESAIDLCEDLANVIETILIKHT